MNLEFTAELLATGSVFVLIAMVLLLTLGLALNHYTRRKQNRELDELEASLDFASQGLEEHLAAKETKHNYKPSAIVKSFLPEAMFRPNDVVTKNGQSAKIVSRWYDSQWNYQLNQPLAGWAIWKESDLMEEDNA